MVKQGRVKRGPSVRLAPAAWEKEIPYLELEQRVLRHLASGLYAGSGGTPVYRTFEDERRCVPDGLAVSGDGDDSGRWVAGDPVSL